MGDIATQMSNFLTKYSDKVQREMPEGYSIEQVKRLALHLMDQSKDLAQCSPESLYLCILKAAHLDLAIDLGEAHIVRYGQQATLMLDYKGLIKLAKRSGAVAHVKADVVRDGDEFFYQRSLDPSERRLIHKPIPFNDAEIIGSYAIFDLSIGYSEFEILSKTEIAAIRKKAAAGSMMWKEFYEEGAKKAVLRRGLKTLELLPEDRRSIIAEMKDHYEIGRVEQSATHVLTERFSPKTIEDKPIDAMEIPKAQEAEMVDADQEVFDV